MTPDEIAAVSRISPTLAAYVVLAVPLTGVLAWLLPGIQRWPIVRRMCLRLFGWDPGEVPQDETGRRTMELVDQLQEEIAKCRQLLERYGIDIDQLRRARVMMLLRLGELRDAAIAARTQVHHVERQFGLPETEFAPLPGDLKELGMGEWPTAEDGLSSR